MKKHIIKWSYRLGMLALILGLVARAIDVVVPTSSAILIIRGDAIGYIAFMHGAFLFFVTTIATVCYVWFNSQESRSMPDEHASKKSDRGALLAFLLHREK